MNATGSKIKKILIKTRSIFARSLSYMQTLLVLSAFVLMIVLSYLYVSDIEHKHLMKNVEDAFLNTQTNIEADLQEPKTILASLSQTLQDMILYGCSVDDLQRYLADISNNLLSNEEFMVGFDDFYGYFEVFGGIILSGRGLELPKDYEVSQRPWYIAAMEANGKIAITSPYMSVSNNVVLTYTRRIFDDNGKPLGVVSLNVTPDRIGKYAISSNFIEGGYGILLDGQLRIIAHLDTLYLYKALRDIKDGELSSLADELELGEDILERELKNYKGERSVVFFHKMKSGWYLGIVTPKDKYYMNTRNMITVLSIFGLILSVLLSFILLRALNAYVIKMQEAEYSKKTKETLENILNGINTMTYVNIPETGELLFVNASMKKHYKIQGDPIGLPCYKVFQKGLNERCDFCPCKRLDKESDKIIKWEEHSSLTKRTYQNTDCYIKWIGGEMVHLQSSVDITELIAAKEQAIQASQIKSKFLAAMSHEIRTPMNAILGITEIQLQDESLPQSMREVFSEIYNSGDLLIGIINDILDLSKIEADKMELNFTKYNVASLINDTVRLNMMHNSKPVEFELSVDENTLAELFGDELRIKQILNNLLSNAYKYTEAGVVKLYVYTELKNTEEDTTLVFRVSDTGIGMNSEEVGRLFEEYSRFNMEINRVIEGTGLGMNITWRLIKIMNGMISVESEPNKGTVFLVHLPQKKINNKVLGKELVQNLQNFRVSSSTQMKKAKIVREYMPYGSVLIVDDVDSNLYVAKGLMSPYGLTIDTVYSGFDAIDKIKSGKVYDIIFMDHMMPEMDGIKTTKIIRNLGYNHPIIALTANAVTGQSKIFLENGFDDFISKPIDIRQLNMVLNKFIRNKQPPEKIAAAQKRGNSSEADIALQAIFLLDVKKTLPIIEKTFENIEQATYDDIHLFTITVHAMKSALANISEHAASKLASILEKAGKENNRAIIKAQAKGLIDFIRRIKERIEAENKNYHLESDVDEDPEFLREQLRIICEACAVYDGRPVDAALKALRKLSWKKETLALIDKIAEHILYGDFNEVGKLAAEFK